MPELTTADGTPLDIDPAVAATAEQEFARSLAAPSGDPGPPRRAARARAGPPPPAPAPRVAKGARAKSSKAGTPPPPLSRDQMMAGVAGLVQLPIGVCLILSRRAADPVPLQADAVTLAAAAIQLAEACADTAEHDERFARALAKVCAAGPYAALTGTAVSLGAQLARNHGVIALPGTTDPHDLIEPPTVTQHTEEDAPDVTSPLV